MTNCLAALTALPMAAALAANVAAMCSARPMAYVIVIRRDHDTGNLRQNALNSPPK